MRARGVTVGNSGLCCCTCVNIFWVLINSLVCWFCSLVVSILSSPPLPVCVCVHVCIRHVCVCCECVCTCVSVCVYACVHVSVCTLTEHQALPSQLLKLCQRTSCLQHLTDVQQTDRTWFDDCNNCWSLSASFMPEWSSPLITTVVEPDVYSNTSLCQIPFFFYIIYISITTNLSNFSPFIMQQHTCFF